MEISIPISIPKGKREYGKTTPLGGSFPYYRFSMEKRLGKTIFQRMKKDYENRVYDVAGIVNYAIANNIDIATQATEKEWKMFAYAFVVLGLDEDSFVAISDIHGDATQSESRNAYRRARNNVSKGITYGSEEHYLKKVIYFAKNAEPSIPLKQFLVDGSEIKPRPKLPPPPKPQHKYLDSSLVANGEAVAEQTTLFKYLSPLFDYDKVLAVFRAYRVGGSKWYWKPYGLSSSFPLIDRDGNIRNCQLSQFYKNGKGIRLVTEVDENGRETRRELTEEEVEKRDDGSKVKSWAMARLGLNGQYYNGLCFFGEHLINRDGYKDKPIAIVEAPKTALVCSVIYPEYLWLACISLEWLNGSTISLEPLRKREIWLFPDRDGQERWMEKAKPFRPLGLDVGVSDIMKRYPNGKPKDDIADILLRIVEAKAEDRMAMEAERRLTLFKRLMDEEARTHPHRAEAIEQLGTMMEVNPQLSDFLVAMDIDVRTIRIA